jgi:hypothetical protein
VAATNSNLPPYLEKSYFSDQQLPESAPMFNKQYNPPVQQRSYYPVSTILSAYCRVGVHMYSEYGIYACGCILFSVLVRLEYKRSGRF